MVVGVQALTCRDGENSRLKPVLQLKLFERNPGYCPAVDEGQCLALHPLLRLIRCPSFTKIEYH